MTEKNMSPSIKFNNNEDDFKLEIESKLPSRAQIEVVKEIIKEQYPYALCEDEKKLKIEPHYVRDYEIKKPTEKKPNLIKMLVNIVRPKESVENADESNAKEPKKQSHSGNI